MFGDAPEYVDFFYGSFRKDIEGYAICSDEGKVVSALTCFRCGVFRDPACDEKRGPEGGSADGRPVYVSYAVCTDPEYRGQGHAAALTGYVRDMVTEQGGISLVSPAEESLIGYYAGIGYRESFFVDEHEVRAEDAALNEESGWSAQTADNEQSAADGDTRFWGLDPDGNAGFLDEEDGEAFEPELSVESVSGSMYNRYREEFLADIPHVEMSPDMMEFLRADGEGGLLVINGGDAVCRVAYAGKTVMLDELLVNPQLLAFSEEIGEEIALQLTEYFGAESLVYRTPGCGRCQSMADAGTAEVTGYFGFPIE